MPNDLIHHALTSEIAARRPDIDAAALRDPAATLNDLGIDSLMVVDLIMEFAERYGADLETVLDGVEPPQSLADFTALLSTFQQKAA
ncbi:acyl carrier protein [Pacificoceanicola onchidii]|uniref:acyl carrier protein n=1 Tax=Pacificoceanicola onchidii TaxID=2562685 RepID=UPI0010A5B6F7|nr:acyl carrier protein [Pacificoceanicola onchidii]